MIWILGLALVAATSPAQAQPDVYLRIYDSGETRIPIILLPVKLHDDATADLGETFSKVLQNDLWLSSLILPYSSEDKDLSPRDPFLYPSNFQARIGLETTLSVNENNISIQAELRDLDSGEGIFRKSYQGCNATLRLLIHTLADDLVNALTGQNGIAKSRIAFSAETPNGKEVFIMDYDGVNTSQVSKLKTALFTPGWSRNGRGLLFTSHREAGQGLHALDLVSGKVEVLYSDGSLTLAPAWSPDGKKIAFVSTKHDSPEIYVMEANGKKVRRLTVHPAIDSAPTWSPTSKEIAFSSDRLGSPQLFIMDNEGSDVRQLRLEGSYNDSPAWSPRGDKIAFVARGSANFDIFVCDIASETVTQLTQEAGDNEDPSWSPDGYRIAFSSTRAGRRDIYTMRWDGSDVNRLTFRGGCSSPAWSWNGRPKEDYQCSDKIESARIHPLESASK